MFKMLSVNDSRENDGDNSSFINIQTSLEIDQLPKGQEENRNKSASKFSF